MPAHRTQDACAPIMSDSILIVDDERGIRETLSAVLRDEGFKTEAVESGEA